MAWDDPNRPHRYMAKKLDTILGVWYERPELSLHEVINLAIQEARKDGLLTDDEFVAALDKVREKR